MDLSSTVNMLVQETACVFPLVDANGVGMAANMGPESADNTESEAATLQLEPSAITSRVSIIRYILDAVFFVPASDAVMRLEILKLLLNILPVSGKEELPQNTPPP